MELAIRIITAKRLAVTTTLLDKPEPLLSGDATNRTTASVIPRPTSDSATASTFCVVATRPKSAGRRIRIRVIRVTKPRPVTAIEPR